MSEQTRPQSEEQRVSDGLLRQYMRPWYAAFSVTIYRDVKVMAAELLSLRKNCRQTDIGKALTEIPVLLKGAQANPVSPAEAKEMRDV